MHWEPVDRPSSVNILTLEHLKWSNQQHVCSEQKHIPCNRNSLGYRGYACDHHQTRKLCENTYWVAENDFPDLTLHKYNKNKLLFDCININLPLFLPLDFPLTFSIRIPSIDSFYVPKVKKKTYSRLLVPPLHINITAQSALSFIQFMQSRSLTGYATLTK